MGTRAGHIAFALFASLAQPSIAIGQSLEDKTSALCWRSMQPVGSPDDTDVPISEPTLAVTPSGEVWLSGDWNDTSIRRWKDEWMDVPWMTRPKVEAMGAEAVAASPSGRLFVITAANRDDGSSELHVGRFADETWEWLGAPLISSKEPFTHAHRPSIAFLGEHPVVAWSEELHARLAGMFVARWDGKVWRPLGILKPESEDTFLSPAIAVDAKQNVWLAWIGTGGRLRVARWDGSAWIDVGRGALEKLSDAQGPTTSRKLSLEIDSKGQAWVLRLAAKADGSALALARWNGTEWNEVGPPRGPIGKDSTVWSASMILRNDRPLIAWSQADATDNRHLFVAGLGPDDRWIALLSDLHLVEGVSNVTDVTLAFDDRQLFVSWNERGKGQAPMRLISAYECGAGERPASSPRSIVERDTWPTTVADAARRLAADLDEESKTRVRSTKKEELAQFNFFWGMGIRNSLGLWRGNDKLLQSCGNGQKAHPESCSMVIIEAVWALLQP